MNSKSLNPLKVVLLQSDLEWEGIEANLAHFHSVFSALDSDSSLVVLPEMFATGFTMNPTKFSGEQLESVFHWMQRESERFGFVLGGSSIASADGGFYNRFMMAFPDGKKVEYNKRHLFRMGGEQSHYLPGSERVIADWKGWRFCPMVCYDLRFPVWSRNRNDYDVLLYVANWPSSRREVWLTLLKARAIENQCYVLGVNRVGKDPLVSYSGDSVVFSPKGVMLSGGTSDQPSEVVASIDRVLLDQFRAKFEVWKDSDNFYIVD